MTYPKQQQISPNYPLIHLQHLLQVPAHEPIMEKKKGEGGVGGSNSDTYIAKERYDIETHTL